MAELKDTENVAAEASDGTRLIRFEDGGGAVHEAFEVPEVEGGGTDYWEVEYDQFKDAVLHFALWLRVNGFERPDRNYLSFIPTKIAVEGKETMAAWLYLQGASGHPVARSVVAEKLNVTEDTVSRYLSRIRSEITD